MKILVINSGSSSIKFQLLEMDNEAVLASGLVERIGEEEGQLKCTFMPGTASENVVKIAEPIADHNKGMLLAVNLLTNPEHGVLADKSDIAAVGHRVVHGGEDFHQPAVITAEIMDAIKKNIPLAPLHNPANIDGIRVAQELFPGVPQVAVFDTAFHQSIPPHAYHYALPYELYEKDRIRRYGFHGTSHKFVANECAKLMGKPIEDLNIISVHLGNGCSMTAVKNGKSVDTTLGLTPLEGLVMGTRSGDVDPAIHAFLARNRGMSIDEIDTMLNKESGLKGLCGLNDMRDIHDAIGAGNERAKLALDVQTYRNKKYIGAYMAVLGHVDAIIFTAGIGENDEIVRAKSVEGLEPFGIVMDAQANGQRVKKPTLLSAPESRVQIWGIPTNEELAIAREAQSLVCA
ncbi:acetate kinase [Desulforhopalus sp. IMCC35007]|uniref:acetate kinase n=1 Tax=Desulforhopalus sp. IMCC35007 TaxID=2569543 RepID=UPI0010AE4E28|nr:acetate kinase [Desulforhopalus sp. IMCC35007]TKB07992.1 acetate kinase [Desulforhopalus sp. IMCC35007]